MVLKYMSMKMHTRLKMSCWRTMGGKGVGFTGLRGWACTHSDGPAIQVRAGMVQIQRRVCYT